jgi:uncharacterized lipoprotein YddW (UPF0748 family)
LAVRPAADRNVRAHFKALVTHLLLGIISLFLTTVCDAVSYQPATTAPLLPPREFRAAWIATVANIDWPSKPGLTTAQQKAELIALLNRAAQLKLNAIVFQVRPACDAMYASTNEPWSEYLTGVMGKAPEPFYDPLALAIQEAHRRGMELHAWINPYRALHKSHQGSVSSNHISRTHPEFVHSYGEYLWLDPGEPAVQEYSLRVVMDVLKRYDIDGIVFDDYFYPDPTGRDFPDEASWRKYAAHGKLSRDDWRRENVNAFIARVYTSIKATKPWVKFGISPPGIWRPGNPPQITGSDNYNKLFADTRKWLVNGWMDYCAPQLYWPIEDAPHSFPVLLKWWEQQNPKGRHIWPGLADSRMASWPANEISNQIDIQRRQPGSKGFLLYSATNLVGNSALTRFLELQPRALIPASPWLGATPPSQPMLSANDVSGHIRVDWNAGTNSTVRWWVLQTKLFGDWRVEILPSDVTSTMAVGIPEAISVTAIDRVGNASVSRVLQRMKNPAEERILWQKN